MTNEMKTVANRNGRAIGGGDLWRVMRNGACIGTIVQSKVIDMWHVAHTVGSRMHSASFETKAEAFAFFGIAS